MKKILIVCAGGLDATDPGAKEMRFLANELSKQYEISFLTTYLWKHQKKQVANFKTLYIKDPKYTNLQFLERLKNCKSAPLELLLKLYGRLFRPLKTNHKSFYRWLRRQKENYDFIISVSNPFYNHEYANEIKERLSIKYWFLLLLDPYSDSSVFPEGYKEKAEVERTFFQKSQQIFVTLPIFQNAKHSPLKEFQEKITIIPDTFIIDKTSYQKARADGIVHLGYMGMLYHQIRSPEPLLNMLSFLPDYYLTDFYFKGCEELVKKNVPNERVMLHGMITDPERYNKTVGEVDILLSIGNNLSNQIPSKLYDCIGFGKPIIHFFQDKNDLVIQKFSKYPGIRFIDYHQDPQTAAKELITACEELKNFHLSYSEIKDLFPEDTMEFVLNCFIQELDSLS